MADDAPQHALPLAPPPCENSRVRTLPFLLCAQLACASSARNVEIENGVQEAPLPNGSPQTALPLPLGVEVQGAVGCGQVGWYRIEVPNQRALRVTIHGQAQENALGATATLTVTAINGLELGNMMIPVFARAPNWDPREQAFPPVPAGPYLARVNVDPNGCQRLAYRLTIQ